MTAGLDLTGGSGPSDTWLEPEVRRCILAPESGLVAILEHPNVSAACDGGASSGGERGAGVAIMMNGARRRC